VEDPFRPAELCFGARGHFFARAVATDAPGTIEVLKAAHAHKGASVTEILQNCVIFNNGTHESVYTPAGRKKNASYVRFPNPLQGQTNLQGFTVSAWVLRGADDLWGSLWTFTDKMGSQTANIKQRMSLSGNGFINFDDGTNSFDLNRPNDAGTNATGYIPVGTWTLVTVTVSASDGISFYVDGVKKAHKTFTSTAGTASTAAAAARLFDYQTLLNFITSAGYMQFGAGSLWGSAEAAFDDLLIYNRALSAADVRGLATLSNRVTDFGPQGLVGIHDIHQSPFGENEMVNGKWLNGKCLDLTGRPVRTSSTSPRLKPGLYIINGRKVMVQD
jgi:hypothetical protein